MTDPESSSGELDVSVGEGAPQPDEQMHLVHISSEQTFSGPLPPPVLLRDYEEILPGAAERILKIAEREAESVWEGRTELRRLNSRLVDDEGDRTRRGMYIGGALGGGLLVVAVVLALEGATWPAVVAAISQLVPTLAVFIPNARARWRNRGRE